ncbi:hypothetical protein NPIL_229501 [Nephila pilipes]|uniref:Uncharacterized protein n=1 Tax=Nephila pilipes TaxID=299642 RepID=A0A8X6Q4W0_NEPPI|nr:hypothetical protein NPIL_229501 [Nephila pilipes]
MNPNFVQENISYASKCKPEKTQRPESTQSSENNRIQQTSQPKRKRTENKITKTEKSQENISIIDAMTELEKLFSESQPFRSLQRNEQS